MNAMERVNEILRRNTEPLDMVILIKSLPDMHVGEIIAGLKALERLGRLYTYYSVRR
jgi:hypothetical protein